MIQQQLLWQVETQCRHLMSEINRNPYSPLFGCFDRRFWGWKIVDFPEATYQRNVYSLAWWYKKLIKQSHNSLQDQVFRALRAGLLFTTTLQHHDGSFDQAFPKEHSFGATAFLAQPVLEAYLTIDSKLTEREREQISSCLFRAGHFLSNHKETHGFISNHLAGAALSLFSLGYYFKEVRFIQSAEELLAFILSHQTSEGWFPEYEGADPGYQTLCIYYLAQVYRSYYPNNDLRDALASSIQFLSWFVHPDGTFGGEYGSRRTAIYYPGGLALLAHEFPLAAQMTNYMLNSIVYRNTTTLLDIDIGNLAPLLANYILTVESLTDQLLQNIAFNELPQNQDYTTKDFLQAGLFIRSTPHYYAIFGGSNGGILKVFHRKKKQLVYDDSGYIGETENNQYITTQKTDLSYRCQVEKNEITLVSFFYSMVRIYPSPLSFLFLRIINLTLMRFIFLGNMIKNLLATVFISGQRKIPLLCKRKVIFLENQIIIQDQIISHTSMKIKWLECGQPFIAIHMASSGYFENELKGSVPSNQKVNIEELNTQGSTRVTQTILFD